ncbi:MAG: hypothetical protein JWO58_2313 [Chitinophagaceae bacterium]|nr:hypothetical protein [Chitinophagaceae bacterium]
MKNQLFYTRLLQFCIVFSFFLPFFFTGCEQNSSEESAALDSTATVDSMALVPADTMMVDSTDYNITDSSQTTDAETNDTLSTAKNINPDEPLSRTIARRYTWLRPLLISGDHNDSGAALVIDITKYFMFLSIILALLLIKVNLIIKFIDRQAIVSQILLNSIALLFLCVYEPAAFSYNILWGYWVCIGLLATTVVVDVYRLLRTRVPL